MEMFLLYYWVGMVLSFAAYSIYIGVAVTSCKRSLSLFKQKTHEYVGTCLLLMLLSYAGLVYMLFLSYYVYKGKVNAKRI